MYSLLRSRFLQSSRNAFWRGALLDDPIKEKSRGKRHWQRNLSRHLSLSITTFFIKNSNSSGKYAHQAPRNRTLIQDTDTNNVSLNPTDSMKLEDADPKMPVKVGSVCLPKYETRGRKS